MNPTALALLGYISWVMLLVILIAGQRAGLTLSGKRAANSFKPEGSDISAFSERLCRAHANCYESFPYLGGLLLLALAADLTGITDSLAIILLACRIGQSTVHIISTSVWFVQIRFAFFVAQLIICLYWIILYFTHFSI